MPYIGEDWRSTGDLWVKTDSGWQKLDALRQNVNRHIRRLGLKKQSLQNELNQNVGEATIPDRQPEKDNGPRKRFLSGPLSPYLLLPRGSGKTGTYYTLSEAMLRLDFAGAVHEGRRFNYICKTLELLVNSHFSSVSGTAQKNLLNVIDQTLSVAIESQNKFNMRRVRGIITTASKALEQMKYMHVGPMWKARIDQLEEMLNRLNRVIITEREEDDGLMMTELPEECIRLILRRLGDHEDIINTGATSQDMYRLSNEPTLWRRLCYFHFTKEQILREIGVGADENVVRWKPCYQKLYKQYGRKELFADMLQVCSHCNCVFWQDGGHPCSLETPPEGSKRVADRVSVTNLPVTPQQFLKLFPA